VCFNAARVFRRNDVLYLEYSVLELGGFCIRYRYPVSRVVNGTRGSPEADVIDSKKTHGTRTRAGVH